MKISGCDLELKNMLSLNPIDLGEKGFLSIETIGLIRDMKIYHPIHDWLGSRSESKIDSDWDKILSSVARETGRIRAPDGSLRALELSKWTVLSIKGLHYYHPSPTAMDFYRNKDEKYYYAWFGGLVKDSEMSNIYPMNLDDIDGWLEDIDGPDSVAKFTRRTRKVLEHYTDMAKWQCIGSGIYRYPLFEREAPAAKAEPKTI